MQQSRGCQLATFLHFPREISIFPVLAVRRLSSEDVEALRRKLEAFNTISEEFPETSIIRMRTNDLRLYAQIDPERHYQSRWDPVDYRIELANSGLAKRIGLPCDSRTLLVDLPCSQGWSTIPERVMPDDLELPIAAQYIEIYRTMESRELLRDPSCIKNASRDARKSVREGVKTSQGRTRACWVVRARDSASIVRSPAFQLDDLGKWSRASRVGDVGVAMYRETMNHVIHADDDDPSTVVEDQIVG